eukprot:jgi/Botrbrau1/15135/Bobra.0149s0007.1
MRHLQLTPLAPATPAAQTTLLTSSVLVVYYPCTHMQPLPQQQHQPFQPLEHQQPSVVANRQAVAPAVTINRSASYSIRYTIKM